MDPKWQISEEIFRFRINIDFFYIIYLYSLMKMYFIALYITFYSLERGLFFPAAQFPKILWCYLIILFFQFICWFQIIATMLKGAPGDFLVQSPTDWTGHWFGVGVDRAICVHFRLCGLRHLRINLVRCKSNIFYFLGCCQLTWYLFQALSIVFLKPWCKLRVLSVAFYANITLNNANKMRSAFT